MIKRSEYQGKPVLQLFRSEEDRFPFSFGQAKAKLIVDNLEEIKKFAAEAVVAPAKTEAAK